ncbi:MAG TPA: hypothetical protein PLQ52_00710 [Lacunisphaera sp.]|nr:hypothetical protein [Lacunisphaera sp.]
MSLSGQPAPDAGSRPAPAGASAAGFFPAFIVINRDGHRAPATAP